MKNEIDLPEGNVRRQRQRATRKETKQEQSEKAKEDDQTSRADKYDYHDIISKRWPISVAWLRVKKMHNERAGDERE